MKWSPGNFNKAYEIKQKYCRENNQTIGVTLNGIGNYVQALSFYSKALQCRLTQYHAAVTQLNISTIYMINKDYDRAIHLSTEIRNFLQQQNSRLHLEINYAQAFIADIHLDQGEYIEAEQFYCAVLEKSRVLKTFSSWEQTRYVKVLADLYPKQEKNEEAIKLCSDLLTEYEQDTIANHHRNIAHIKIKLAEFYDNDHGRQIQFLREALEHLEKKSFP